MNPFYFTLAAFVVLSVGIVVEWIWSRRKLKKTLRKEWGVVKPITRIDSYDAPEAWRTLYNGDEPAGIDERTWEDLELKNVVATLDRTITGLGTQVLYSRMRSGRFWRETPLLETLSKRFQTDPELRERVGIQLHTAGPTLGNGLWLITSPTTITIRWWYWSFPFLSLAMFASLIAIPLDPRALIVTVAVGTANMVARAATARQLTLLLNPIRQMAPLIGTGKRLVRTIRKDLGDHSEIERDLKHLRPLRRIARWVGPDVYRVGTVAASIWEYLNVLFILDANAFLLSARRMKSLGHVLARVAHWVGDVDLALAVASLRSEPRRWCVPTWSETPTTDTTEIWHPLVEAPVSNDIELRSGGGIVITGANMSGKSTYLRTVGIAAVLARALNTCPASSWTGRAYRVRSLIGRSDDLAAGKSYYQVEADGVVTMLQQSESRVPALFLLDELLRGTNTVERLAAGQTVLRALVTGKKGPTPHTVVVATHDGEMVSMLAGLYEPWHFRETISNGELNFDYRRRAGPATTRTAIALLAMSGAPKAVVQDATKRAEQLDAAPRIPDGA